MYFCISISDKDNRTVFYCETVSGFFSVTLETLIGLPGIVVEPSVYEHDPETKFIVIVHDNKLDTYPMVYEKIEITL